MTHGIQQQVYDDGAVKVHLYQEKVRGALEYIDELRDNLPDGMTSAKASAMMLAMIEDRARRLISALDDWLLPIQIEPLR